MLSWSVLYSLIIIVSNMGIPSLVPEALYHLFILVKVLHTVSNQTLDSGREWSKYFTAATMSPQAMSLINDMVVRSVWVYVRSTCKKSAIRVHWVHQMLSSLSSAIQLWSLPPTAKLEHCGTKLTSSFQSSWLPLCSASPRLHGAGSTHSQTYPHLTRTHPTPTCYSNGRWNTSQLVQYYKGSHISVPNVHVRRRR